MLGEKLSLICQTCLCGEFIRTTLCFSLLREAIRCRRLPPRAHVCVGPQQLDRSPSECGVYDGAHGPCSAARRR